MVVAGREWSPTANPYGYTTRELDPESLLLHYRARTYHPTLKQFMQRDPLGYVDGPNLHQYVLGNPVRYNDSFGQQGGGKGSGANGQDPFPGLLPPDTNPEWSCCRRLGPRGYYGSYAWARTPQGMHVDEGCRRAGYDSGAPYSVCESILGMPPGVKKPPPSPRPPFPSRPPGYGKCWMDCMAQNGCGTVIGGIAAAWSGVAGTCLGVSGLLSPVAAGAVGALGAYCTTAGAVCSLYCIGA